MKNDNENKDQKEKVESEKPASVEDFGPLRQSDSEASEAKEEKESQVDDKIAEFEDKYKRALADYQNLERRSMEQKREWIMQAGKNILLKLLPVLDTLMLAQKHMQDKGLAISIDQFLKVLEEEGVEKIKTIGEKFDPQTMEAIGTMEGKEGQVLEEARAGFRLHDTVLRSAQVIVGK